MNKDELEKSLLRVQDWIKSADQKNSIFLALVFGVFAIGGSHLFPYLVSRISFTNSYAIFFAILIVAVYGVSILKSVFILRPSQKSDKKSVTYYGHIAEMTLEEYRSKVSGMTPKKYIDELTEQIHICSTIAKNKHKNLSDAILIFILAVVLTILYIGISYVS